MEVVQTFNITSLSDIAAYRVFDFRENSRHNAKYHVPALRVKMIVLCYFDSGMRSINILMEDFLRHKFFF